MITEADTCRKYVIPKLYSSGWNDDQINEEKTFTDGRIVVTGEKYIRKKQKRADILLKFRRDFSIAVVEAKSAYKNAGDGLQQAKEYAEILGLKFAYSTNSKGIVEHDFITGKDTDLENFPTPDELWIRFSRSEGIKPDIAERLLSPCNTLPGKIPRYYQEIATFATILRGRGPIYQEGTGKLAINQKCVRWNGVDSAHAKEVSDVWIQSLPSHSFIQENDLLVNSTGEGTIGRACVVTPNAIGLPFDSHVLVARTVKDKVLPTFITYFLRSPYGQAAIEDSKGAKTTKQTELGTAKLGEIIIPLPPLPEQRRIVAYLNDLQAKVDAARRLQAETGAELGALLPAVLDKAFKGEM
ncbi:type I restriction enzyme, R subunit [groundwater metagenome]